MANIELLKKAMARVEIEAAKPPHERLWDQTEWVTKKECGTAYCFAGWVCVEAGYKGYIGNGGFLTGSGGGHVETKASELLDIDIKEAESLFCASNTLGDLRYMVAEISGEEHVD